MLSLLRRLAQKVRHAPGLRKAEPPWNLLRAPYLRLLGKSAGRRGLQVTVGGCSLRLHPRFATQNWETLEPEAYRAFAALVRPGDTVIDIGAHIGTYTLIALQRSAPAGRVVAYEPHGVTRRYLSTHLAWAGMSGRVIVRDACCGARSGQADFYFQPGDDQAEGTNGLAPVEGFQKKSVPIVTLDDEMDRWGLAPHLVKVDVEGGEWDVLQGAERTLARCRPTLLLSVHPPALARLGMSPERVLGRLKAQGYQVEVLAQDHEMHVLARGAGIRGK